MYEAPSKKTVNFHSHTGIVSFKLKKGFALLELLVAIFIISASMAILLPVLGNARHRARSIITMNNQRQIAVVVNSYANDNNGKYPESVATIGRLSQHWNWQEPTMMTSSYRRSPGIHRSVSAYLQGYIDDASTMFCSNGPREYKYLQKSWDAGDEWDNPETPSTKDPVVGTYCFYWNYIGFLPEQDKPFIGPESASASQDQSNLLVSDYFGFGHWRSPKFYGSCEKFRASAITPGTWVSSDYWSHTEEHLRAGFKSLKIKLHAAYVDGHVERYRPAETVPMKVSMTSDGTVPYPDELGPGIFYLPLGSLN